MGEELACGVLAGLASYADPAQLKFQGGSRLSPGAGLAPIRASHDSVVLAPGVPEGTDVISYATPKVGWLRGWASAHANPRGASSHMHA